MTDIAITLTPYDLRVREALSVLCATGVIRDVRVVRTGIPQVYEIQTDPGFARAAEQAVIDASIVGVRVQAYDDDQRRMSESVTRCVWVRP